jgi:hypothetical protein
VQEHRREDRENPALVPALRGEVTLELGGEPRILQDATARDRLASRRSAVREIPEVRRLPRDLGVTEQERVGPRRRVRAGGEDRLPEQEGGEVQRDDAERDPGEPVGGVVIPKRKHPPPAFGSRQPS